ncbi:MAG: hypothetical protein LBM98_10020 [Oscillospiraceae bacterium]|jgi:hypothetical protein|nr:hypothetical protein [Oscillospiraceae bacterium]
MKSYKDLTIDDLHEIRRENDKRFEGHSWEERVASTNEGASVVLAKLAKIRAKRLAASDKAA